MFIGFVVWSMIAVIFLCIGVSCRKAQEAVGFFTFAKPPIVKDVKKYNNAVSVLWFVSAGTMEIIGIPFLFLEQNSPLFIFIGLAVMAGVIAMMIAYIRIEANYRK